MLLLQCMAMVLLPARPLYTLHIYIVYVLTATVTALARHICNSLHRRSN
jgi:hypothetical protein